MPGVMTDASAGSPESRTPSLSTSTYDVPHDVAFELGAAPAGVAVAIRMIAAATQSDQFFICEVFPPQWSRTVARCGPLRTHPCRPFADENKIKLSPENVDRG